MDEITTTTPETPVFVLYHGNCYDGFGAAYAAYQAYGETATYFPVLYGKPVPPGIPDNALIYICDFSYPRQTLIDLAKRSKRLIVLDHHKTAKEDLADLEKELELITGKNHIVRFDMSKSGAVMTWEFFFPTRDVPQFFLYLQDRDLWTFKLFKSQEVSTALRMYPMSFSAWRDLIPAVERLMQEGEVALKLTNQMVDTMCQQAHLWVFNVVRGDCFALDPEEDTGEVLSALKKNPDVHFVPVANATVFFSEVGNRLLELHPEAKFTAYYLDRADGQRQWGMRSRKDFDCSAVAKAFGGGGHPQASGFTQQLKR